MQTLHLKSIIQNPPSGDRATPRPFHPYTFLRHPFLGPPPVTRHLAPWNAKPYSTGVRPQKSAKGLLQLLRHHPTEAAWK
jgi:hypothetical protein